MRRFVAELVRKGDDADLIYLADSDDYRQATARGFKEYPGFPASTREHPSALSGFLKRMPPRSRRDFNKFLTSIRIPAGVTVSDFALLGYSGAKLPDDDFTIVHPFSTALPPFELLVNVQGYRYETDKLSYERLAEGMAAEFEAEPVNEQDGEAVRIMIDGQKAGYVSRGLATQLHQWMRVGYSLEATLERINGTADRPSLFLYLAVRPPLCLIARKDPPLAGPQENCLLAHDPMTAPPS
jgi:hypothetical protein